MCSRLCRDLLELQFVVQNFCEARVKRASLVRLSGSGEIASPWSPPNNNEHDDDDDRTNDGVDAVGADGQAKKVDQ